MTKKMLRFNSFLILALALLVSAASTAAFGKSAISDYDGDGRSDYVTVRTDAGKLTWWISYNNAQNKTTSVSFGNAGDVLVPADYDGDGKTDIAVWRASQATFYIMQSKTQTPRFEKFGLEGDDPSIVADYDGDGKADLAVYRPGTKEKPQSAFYYRGSKINAADGNFVGDYWGLLGDIPFSGDFDGDGKADLCVRRNRNKDQQPYWYIRQSKDGDVVHQWGLSGDVNAIGDYDGDGKTDLAVMRSTETGPESKLIFYMQNSGNGQLVARYFGLAESDLNVPGDYDGDGKVDIGLWRKTDQMFWIMSSNVTADVKSLKWGSASDTPVSVAKAR